MPHVFRRGEAIAAELVPQVQRTWAARLGHASQWSYWQQYKERVMNRTKRKAKLIVLAQLLAAGCWGWSCAADLRDAAWTGALDYVTGTTTAGLECMFSVEGCFAVEE